jgi:hypothetical protein
VWYSLVGREEKMEDESKSNSCLNVCSSMFWPCKIILLTKVKKGQTLDKLRKCPNCQSPSYTEETLAYDEKGYDEKT